MRRWLWTVLAAAALGGAAQAQIVKDGRHGYLIIRVILESGGGGGAGGPGGGSPFAPGGSPGAPPQGEGGPEGGPGGVPGRPPFGGPPGFPGGGPPNGPQQTEAARSVVVVVPYNQLQRRRFNVNAGGNPVTNPTLDAITHSLTPTGRNNGVTFLFQDRSQVQFFPRLIGSLETNVHNRHTKWSAARNRLDEGYDLVVDALGYGMVDDAYKYAKEVAEQAVLLKDKGVPAKVSAFQKVFAELAPKIDTPPPQPDDAEKWKDQLQASGIAQGLHYAMVYWGGNQIDPEEMNRRLKALEQNYKAFYLWHALMGVSVKVPERRMVTVLADRATDMPRLRDALDGLPIESDAFYSPRHDLVVLSPEPLDDNGRTFSNLVQAQYQVGWNRADLLVGKVPKVDATRSKDAIARVCTLALVDKAIEHEMDHAAVSRDGSRQLYVASGLLPQNVQLPEWLESGATSFFHKPKGPVFTRAGGRPAGGGFGQPGGAGGGMTMTVGLSSGYGMPNFAMHRYYRDLVSHRELNPAPDVLLRNVLADKYFEAAREGKDIDPPPGGGGNQQAQGGPGGPGGRGGRGAGPAGPPAGEGGVSGSSGGPVAGDGGAGPPPEEDDSPAGKRRARERLDRKARATAWALTYYLNRTRTPGMQQFYAELRRMPRDMRLGEKPVLMTFAKCFNLRTVDGTQIDEAAFKQFATDWVQYMNNVPTTGVDVPIDAATADPSAAGAGVPGGATGEGGPMGGGRPGMGSPPGGPGNN
jgi:hypothetical protein